MAFGTIARPTAAQAADRRPLFGRTTGQQRQDPDMPRFPPARPAVVDVIRQLPERKPFYEGPVRLGRLRQARSAITERSGQLQDQIHYWKL